MRTFFYAIYILLFKSGLAFAGSVNGKAVDGSAGLSGCDVRSTTIKCTPEERTRILDQCYVVIHKEKLGACTWQSCDFTSVVGQKPIFRSSAPSSNEGILKEYGVESVASKTSEWECDRAGGCLPKFPFARHYVTVRQAIEIRKGSDTSDVALKLKSVPLEVMNTNPFIRCATSNQEKVLVRVKSKGYNFIGAGVMVDAEKVNEACDAIRKFRVDGGYALECHAHGDDSGKGTTLIKQWEGDK